MSAPSTGAVSGGGGGGSSGTSRQEFGTLWIQGHNGVPQMVRVLHATPTKLSTGASTNGVSLSSSSNTGSTGTTLSVVRAVVKQPGSAASVAASAGSTAPLVVTQTAPQVVRRSVQLSGSPVQRRLVVATPARRSLTPKRRVLPSTSSVVAVGGASTSASTIVARAGQPAYLSHHQYHQSPHQQHVVVRSSAPAVDGSPVLVATGGGGGGVRKRQQLDDAWAEIKRRRVEKSNKGLRHFSMKVCEKVRAKGKTTYNEVADELVAEYSDPRSCEPSVVDQPYDQKNIRRRVYDALNVLMALHIISKEKKEIRWLGLPSNALQDCKKLEREKAERMRRINVKTQQLKDLLLQQIAFKRLVERNREAERVHGPPLPSSTIQLPFIVVNTDKKTVIDCSISNDKMEYLFNFDDTFEIHDDIEVLKRMGMALGLERGDCSQRDIQLARSLVAPALAPYIDQLGREGAAPHSTADDGDGGVDGDDRSSCVTPNIDVDWDGIDDDLDEEESDDVDRNVSPTD